MDIGYVGGKKGKDHKGKGKDSDKGKDYGKDYGKSKDKGKGKSQNKDVVCSLLPEEGSSQSRLPQASEGRAGQVGSQRRGSFIGPARRAGQGIRRWVRRCRVRR